MLHKYKFGCIIDEREYDIEHARDNPNESTNKHSLIEFHKREAAFPRVNNEIVK